MVAYYLSCLVRAFKDTLDFLSFKPKTLIGIAMYILGLVIYGNVKGFTGVMEKLFDTAAFFLIPGGVVFLILLFWNLIMAPVRLKNDNERRHQNEIDELSEKIRTLENEKDADFLKRNPDYRKYQIIAKLSLALSQVKSFENKLPPEIETKWTKEVERLLSELDPQSLWSFQHNTSLDARILGLEALISNFAPILTPD